MNSQSSPTQTLSNQIIKALKDEGLLEDNGDLQNLLIDGKVKEGDWKIAFEKAINSVSEKGSL